MSGIEFASEAPAPPARARRAATAHARRRAVALGITAGLLALLALLILDAGLSARRMLGDITSARNALIEGGNSVVTGDPAAAVPSFTSAGRAADAAVSASEHPGVKLLEILPYIGDNVRAARAVARSQADTAAAGLTMAQAADTLGWDDLLTPGMRALGSYDLHTIKAATPKLTSVATQLSAALHRLELAGGGHLLGPVAAGYDNAVGVLTRDAALAADARDLARVAPALLGGRGERRYLVGVESLAEPYGPGGHVGPVGILTAKAGQLTLERLAPADPTLADAGSSPDVPTAAESMLAAAAAQGQDSLDGMILVDTHGLEDLLWLVGDVDARSWPKAALSQWNAVHVLDGQVLQGRDAAAADTQQAAVAGDVLQEALGRRPSTEAFGTALAEMVAGRHLAVYARDPKVQALLSRLGATGRLVTSGNPVAVVWNTTGAARTGTLLRRPTGVGVTLAADGSARMRTVVDLENDAPNGPPSVQLGSAFGADVVGSYAADVSVYLPRGAENVAVETSSPSTPTTSVEMGLPVATAPLTAGPGGSMSMIVTAQVPKAVTQVGSLHEYRIRIVPQPSAVPDVVHLTVKIPEGMTIASVADGMKAGGTSARYAGEPDRPLVLWVRYG